MLSDPAAYQRQCRSKTPFTRYNLLSNRLSSRLYNRYDNRLDVCLHDAAGCPTGVSCKRGIISTFSMTIIIIRMAMIVQQREVKYQTELYL